MILKTCTKIPQKAFTYNVEVNNNGRLELDVPLLTGAKVVVFIVEQEQTDSFDDLLDACQGSTDFWNNSFDEEWDNA